MERPIPEDFVMIKFLVTATLLSLILASSPATAKPPKDKGGKPDKEQHEDKELREDLRDIEDGLDLVSSLISAGDARDLAVGAGATGNKPLPNGIRKNLARGKPIPPGIQKTRMPSGFLDELPKRKGYRWEGAGTDLLLVQEGTDLVADVLKDVMK